MAIYRQRCGLSGTEDGVSADILRQFQGVVLKTNSPRAVDGDGNCLFRAASLTVFGTQQRHVYLRTLTAMELIDHPEAYDSASPSAITDLFRSSVTPSSNAQLVSDATTLGTWIELAHIYALSAALSCVIQSYMTPTSAISFANPYMSRVSLSVEGSVPWAPVDSY
jgi:OTU-like cysteine protease